MKLHQFRYAVAVGEELHFTRAAIRLGIGQPPLSQQIKLLEEELGTPIFRRLSCGVELTEAGKAFLPEARAALFAAERAVDAARRAARGELGQFTVGFTGSAALNPMVTELIGKFRSHYPGLMIKLVEQNTNRLLEGLSQRNIDIAFLRLKLGDNSRVSGRVLPAEALWIALPAAHALADRSLLSLTELAGETFILYPRENGSSLYDTIIAACHAAGFSPRIGQEAPQLTSTVSLVAAGVGVALVPASMRQLHPTGVAYLEIAGHRPTTDLVAGYWRDHPMTSTIRNFMRHLEDMLRNEEE